MTNKNFGFGTQIRKSPYFDSTVKWGATGFSVYNHMYIPRDFGSPEQNFWNLIEKSILCDVAVERQVEITGPDAFKFTQLLTPRDLSKLAVGQCGRAFDGQSFPGSDGRRPRDGGCGTDDGCRTRTGARYVALYRNDRLAKRAG